MTRAAVAVSLLVAAGAGLAACGSARVGTPVQPPLQLASAEARAGEKVFMRHCHQCHPGGTAGLGPALNNKPVPGFLIAFQTRHGLGVMPGFGAEHISDTELDALVAYVKAMQDAAP